MRSLAALVLALPLATLASSSLGSVRRRHHNVAARSNHTWTPRAVTYKLEDDYSGQGFWDKWDFFTADDPTHGAVRYVSRDEAFAANMTFVEPDGTIKIGVDSTTVLQDGEKRKSVRLQSQKRYNGGLFIMDVYAMPHGCSVWPAYWMVGPNWPSNGEIDILEGVNEKPDNQITLHTGGLCVVDQIGQATGHLVGKNCTSADGANAGCAILQNQGETYGHKFNMHAGGVYAHSWDSQGITVWYFARGSIPQDITDGNPNPASWGAPTAYFPASDSCNISDLFHDHQIVINTTLCGDWAGGSFNDDGCPGVCTDMVKDPKNYKFAQWSIASLKVYQAS